MTRVAAAAALEEDGASTTDSIAVKKRKDLEGESDSPPNHDDSTATVTTTAAIDIDTVRKNKRPKKYLKSTDGLTKEQKKEREQFLDTIANKYLEAERKANGEQVEAEEAKLESSSSAEPQGKKRKSVERGLIDGLVKQLQTSPYLAHATKDTLMNRVRKIKKQQNSKEKAAAQAQAQAQAAAATLEKIDDHDLLGPEWDPAREQARIAAAASALDVVVGGSSLLLEAERQDKATTWAATELMKRQGEAKQQDKKLPDGTLKSLCRIANECWNLVGTAHQVKQETVKTRAKRNNPNGRQKKNRFKNNTTTTKRKSPKKSSSNSGNSSTALKAAGQALSKAGSDLADLLSDDNSFVDHGKSSENAPYHKVDCLITPHELCPQELPPPQELPDFSSPNFEPATLLHTIDPPFWHPPEQEEEEATTTTTTLMDSPFDTAPIPFDSETATKGLLTPRGSNSQVAAAAAAAASRLSRDNLEQLLFDEDPCHAAAEDPTLERRQQKQKQKQKRDEEIASVALLRLPNYQRTTTTEEEDLEPLPDYLIATTEEEEDLEPLTTTISLTEREKALPIGAAIEHLLGLFSSLSEEILAHRRRRGMAEPWIPPWILRGERPLRMLPRLLSEEEKASPIGSSIPHLLLLFHFLKDRLMARRAAAAAAAAAPPAAAAGTVTDQSPVPVAAAAAAYPPPMEK